MSQPKTPGLKSECTKIFSSFLELSLIFWSIKYYITIIICFIHGTSYSENEEWTQNIHQYLFYTIKKCYVMSPRRGSRY